MMLPSPPRLLLAWVVGVAATLACSPEINYFQSNHVVDLEKNQIYDTFDIGAGLGELPITDADAVSLFVFDFIERAWLETSTNGKYYDSESKRISIHKPLVQFELEGGDGCGDAGLEKQQPFQSERWGEERCAGDKELQQAQMCYLVVVSAEGTSASKMHPEGCAYKEDISQEPACMADSHFPEQPLAKDESSDCYYVKGKLVCRIRKMKIVDSLEPEQDNLRKITKRNPAPYTLNIHSFTRTFSYPTYKFNCKVVAEQYGGPVNLANNVPNTDAQVFYRPNNSVGWGTPLLNLGHRAYNSNNARNKYSSTVHLFTLALQGVSGNECYKCEAHSNGQTTRECLGSCACSA